MIEERRLRRTKYILSNKVFHNSYDIKYKVLDNKVIFDLYPMYNGSARHNETVSKLQDVCSLIRKEFDVECVTLFCGVEVKEDYTPEKAVVAKVRHDALGEFPIPELFADRTFLPMDAYEVYEKAEALLQDEVGKIAKDAEIKVAINQENTGGKWYLTLRHTDGRKKKKNINFYAELEKVVKLTAIDWKDTLDKYTLDEYNRNPNGYIKYYIQRAKQQYDGKLVLAEASNNYVRGTSNGTQILDRARAVIACLGRFGIDTTELNEETKIAYTEW